MSDPAIESFDIVTKIRQILVRYEQILETRIKTGIEIIHRPQSILIIEIISRFILPKQHPTFIFQNSNRR